jgi:hypothetical protein
MNFIKHLVVFFLLYLAVAIQRYWWINDELSQMQLLKRIPEIVLWK